jgi:hypothetical protein
VVGDHLLQAAVQVLQANVRALVLAGVSYEVLEQQQRGVPLRPGAGERDVGQLVVGVDGDRPLGAQLELGAEGVAEPVSLAVPAAAPPLGLLLGQVVGGQHGLLEQPTAYGDAGAAGGAWQRGGLEQVGGAGGAGQAGGHQQPEPVAAHVEQAGGVAALGPAHQVTVALDQHAELEQGQQRRGQRPPVARGVEVDDEVGVGDRAAHLRDELVDQQLRRAAGESGEHQAEQGVRPGLERPALAADSRLRSGRLASCPRPALNSRAALGSTSRR